MRSRSVPPPSRRAVGLALLATTAAGCGEGPLAVPSPEDEDAVLPETFAPAWIGTYEGAGEGSFRGAPTRFDPARLTIALDADSVRDERCFLCVTVTLDTVFVLPNVNPDNPVALTLQSQRDGRTRTLLLERFSGGGFQGNVLQVRLLGEPTTGPGPVTDVSYLLEWVPP